MMCAICKELIPADRFYSPQDYINYLEDVRDMVASGQYDLEEATCPIDDVLGSTSGWVSDVICHVIRCKMCQAGFRCYANTSNGSGSFLQVE